MIIFLLIFFSKWMDRCSKCLRYGVVSSILCFCPSFPNYKLQLSMHLMIGNLLSIKFLMGQNIDKYNCMQLTKHPIEHSFLLQFQMSLFFIFWRHFVLHFKVKLVLSRKQNVKFAISIRAQFTTKMFEQAIRLKINFDAWRWRQDPFKLMSNPININYQLL